MSQVVMNGVTISKELKERVEALRKEEQSFNECLEQVVAIGCWQLEYRRKNNPKKAEQLKAMRKVWKVAQTNPEVAIMVGLGTKVTL